jgi:hypothetical protein
VPQTLVFVHRRHIEVELQPSGAVLARKAGRSGFQIRRHGSSVVESWTDDSTATLYVGDVVGMGDTPDLCFRVEVPLGRAGGDLGPAPSATPAGSRCGDDGGRAGPSSAAGVAGRGAPGPPGAGAGTGAGLGERDRDRDRDAGPVGPASGADVANSPPIVT